MPEGLQESAYKTIADKHFASSDYDKAFKTAKKMNRYRDDLLKKIFNSCDIPSLQQDITDYLKAYHLVRCSITHCLTNCSTISFKENKAVEVNNQPVTEEQTECIETCKADLTAKVLEG